MTKHKEQLKTNAFDRESSSGVRREIENNNRRRKFQCRRLGVGDGKQEKKTEVSM